MTRVPSPITPPTPASPPPSPDIGGELCPGVGQRQGEGERGHHRHLRLIFALPFEIQLLTNVNGQIIFPGYCFLKKVLLCLLGKISILLDSFSSQLLLNKVCSFFSINPQSCFCSTMQGDMTIF